MNLLLIYLLTYLQPDSPTTLAFSDIIIPRNSGGVTSNTSLQIQHWFLVVRYGILCDFRPVGLCRMSWKRWEIDRPIVTTVDYSKILLPLSNHVVTYDLGWPVKVNSAMLKQSIATVYKYVLHLSRK